MPLLSGTAANTKAGRRATLGLSDENEEEIERLRGVGGFAPGAGLSIQRFPFGARHQAARLQLSGQDILINRRDYEAYVKPRPQFLARTTNELVDLASTFFRTQRDPRGNPLPIVQRYIDLARMYEERRKEEGFPELPGDKSKGLKGLEAKLGSAQARLEARVNKERRR